MSSSAYVVCDGIRYHPFVWDTMRTEGILPAPPLSATAVLILFGKEF